MANRRTEFGWLTALGLAAWFAHTPALGQSMYRCVGPDGATSYRDRPCDGSQTQSTVSSSTQASSSATNADRARPQAGLSKEQRYEFERLMDQYLQMFELIGYAQGCGATATRKLEEMGAAVEKRHPDDKTFVGRIAFGGAARGMSKASPPAGMQTDPRKPKLTCPPGALSAALGTRLPPLVESLRSFAGRSR